MSFNDVWEREYWTAQKLVHYSFICHLESISPNFISFREKGNCYDKVLSLNFLIALYIYLYLYMYI